MEPSQRRLVTLQPRRRPTWKRDSVNFDSWTCRRPLTGSGSAFQRHFEGWSPQLRAILTHVAEPVFKWALYDREPLDRWTDGAVTLLGDACHPMLPFMAQGACQAIEDAATLAALLDRHDPSTALDRYEAIRRPRATEIQRRSWALRVAYHLPDGEEQLARDEAFAAASLDPLAPFDWLYGHDPLRAVLAPSA